MVLDTMTTVTIHFEKGSPYIANLYTTKIDKHIAKWKKRGKSLFTKWDYETKSKKANKITNIELSSPYPATSTTGVIQYETWGERLPLDQYFVQLCINKLKHK